MQSTHPGYIFMYKLRNLIIQCVIYVIIIFHSYFDQPISKSLTIYRRETHCDKPNTIIYGLNAIYGQVKY